MDNNTVYEWIMNSTFTVAARMDSLRSAQPFLSASLRPGDAVLDLCCGSGFVSFWLEEQGASVTGMDSAPYMIQMAQEEASRRHSAVNFVLADIFEQDFGRECFDLVTCFDSLSDFPASWFARLCRKAAGSLKPGGKFVIKYADGISYLMERVRHPEGVYQEHPERITFHFKGYLPGPGAAVNTIRNETRGEEYDRHGYLYTPPVVRLAVGGTLEHEEPILLEAGQYLDIFTKGGEGSTGTVE